MSECNQQPELTRWLEDHPDRAAGLTQEEIEELYSIFGVGGPLTAAGVEHFVDVIERKRKCISQLAAIAGTEFLPFVEQFLELVFKQIQPYGHLAQTWTPGASQASQ